MKFIITIASIFSSLFGTIDTAGWASVESPKKLSSTESFEEQDPAVWIVFSKELEREKFLVRLPEDPRYSYLPEGGFELFSSREEDSYLLRVFARADSNALQNRLKELSLEEGVTLIEASQPGPERLDLLYRSEGCWVWETWLLSPHSLYFFQTKSSLLSGEKHRQSVDSLEILSLDK